MYFAGVNLNLDNVIESVSPSRVERAHLVAKHPVAIARFFDKLIQSIIDTLSIDILSSMYFRHRESLVLGGVLGPVRGYYGTVENQGRGSLHLHILIRLDVNMRPSELRSSVKHECFRNNLIEYLEDIIKDDLSWINSNFFDAGSMFVNLMVHRIASWSLNHLLIRIIGD